MHEHDHREVGAQHGRRDLRARAEREPPTGTEDGQTEAHHCKVCEARYKDKDDAVEERVEGIQWVQKCFSQRRSDHSTKQTRIRTKANSSQSHRDRSV